MRDKERRGKITRDYSWELPKRVRGEKDIFNEGREACDLRAEDYILNYGRVFNEFR